MVTIMFVLNLIVNWAAIGSLVTVIYLCVFDNFNWIVISAITTTIMALSVIYILSPTADKNRRRPYRELTQKEHNHVYPAFIHIFNRTNLKNPPVLLIQDEAIPNAMVIGPNTMVLNMGLLTSCNQREVSAVMAHEFGHIVSGDAKKKLVNYAINRVGDLVLGTAVLIIMLISNDGKRILLFPFVAIAIVLKLIRAILVGVLQLGHLAVDRAGEHTADAFVKELGLGEELADFFSRTQDNKGFLLFRTHPYSKNRIKRLRSQEN